MDSRRRRRHISKRAASTSPSRTPELIVRAPAQLAGDNNQRAIRRDRGGGVPIPARQTMDSVALVIALADELTPPSFAAYLLTACWSAARPGELDALRWDDLDFRAETIRIDRQWNAHTRTITAPKHDSRRTIAMTAPVHERLERLPRESAWVFTTLRSTHYTPSSRCFHWNRVRCAAGLGNVALYLATRHFYGWCALNVLELPPHFIALQLGHEDGGRLVRELYGHPDAGMARERTREAFRSVTPITTMRPTNGNAGLSHRVVIGQESATAQPAA